MSDLHMHVRPALAGAPLVLAFEGWNDAGEAATTAARYVQSQISAAPLAEIDCEEFLDFTVQRPRVQVDDGLERRIDWPCTRFVYGRIDGERELVIGVGPEPHLRWRRYTDAVVELVRALAIEEVILLGAYLADVVYSRPVVVSGFASDPERLEAAGVSPTRYEGPTGIVGALADRLRRERVHTLSLWAGLPHYISATPNPRGALALVQKLRECIDLKVDEEPLRRQGAAFEERVSALVAEDPELAEYVRQLKRREFAQ